MWRSRYGTVPSALRLRGIRLGVTLDRTQAEGKISGRRCRFGTGTSMSVGPKYFHMIHDLEVRDLQVNADERGHLVEIFREDWELYDPDPAMSYYSLTYPGVVRAWHRHTRGQVDHFVCPKGRIKIGVYDEREDSPTKGELDTLVIGEHRQCAVRIPGECWHGFKAIGDEPAMLVNFPTELYDYEDPDEQRLSYDTDRIPLDWDAEPHE